MTTSTGQGKGGNDGERDRSGNKTSAVELLKGQVKSMSRGSCGRQTEGIFRNGGRKEEF